jgi:Zn-dependent protease with chaperone function
VWLAATPLVNACTRAQERRADRYALDLTRNAPAFVTAMTRVAAQNLAEERPPWLARLFFSTHPSPAARIAYARAWDDRHNGHEDRGAAFVATVGGAPPARRASGRAGRRS